MFTPFYLSITVAGFSRTVAVWWLEEKESHQKELQKIMGISQLPYILSWLSYFFLNGLLVSLVMITIMRLFVVTEYTKFASGHGFIDLACVYFLYTVSNIGYVMLLCTFFSKAKTGSQVPITSLRQSHLFSLSQLSSTFWVSLMKWLATKSQSSFFRSCRRCPSTWP